MVIATYEATNKHITYQHGKKSPNVYSATINDNPGAPQRLRLVAGKTYSSLYYGFLIIWTSSGRRSSMRRSHSGWISEYSVKFRFVYYWSCLSWLVRYFLADSVKWSEGRIRSGSSTCKHIVPEVKLVVQRRQSIIAKVSETCKIYIYIYNTRPK